MGAFAGSAKFLDTDGTDDHRFLTVVLIREIRVSSAVAAEPRWAWSLELGNFLLPPPRHCCSNRAVPKTLLAFVDDLYEDLELWYPKLRLEEAG